MNKVEGSWPVKDINTLYNAHPTDLRTPYIDKEFLKKDLQKPLSSKLILYTIEYVHCNSKTSFFSELLPLSNGKKQRIITPSNRINLTFCKWEQKNLYYFIQKNVKIVFKEPITLNPRKTASHAHDLRKKLTFQSLNSKSKVQEVTTLCNSTALIPKVTIQHHWWSVNLSHSDLKSEDQFNNNWNGLIFSSPCHPLPHPCWKCTFTSYPYRYKNKRADKHFLKNHQNAKFS